MRERSSLCHHEGDGILKREKRVRELREIKIQI